MCPGFTAVKLKSSLTKLISPPYFPVNLLRVNAKLKFKTFPKKSFNIGTVKIEKLKCNHPGGSYAYKFHFPNGKTLVHVSDNEPSPSFYQKLLIWLKGTDILIHDAQYTPIQYKKKKGWGHSPYPYAVDLAGKAGVRKLILFHYDPGTTDKQLDKIRTQALKYSRRKKYKININLSREGMCVYL